MLIVYAMSLRNIWSRDPHPDFRELRNRGILSEEEILSRWITFFGSVPAGLVAYVNGEKWGMSFWSCVKRMKIRLWSPRFEE